MNDESYHSASGGIGINQSRAQSRADDGEQTVDDQKMNLEMALGKVGGFGLFQYLSLCGLGLTRNSGSPVFYLIAYLTLAQTYNCRFDEGAEYVPCDVAEVICPAREAGTFI